MFMLVPITDELFVDSRAGRIPYIARGLSKRQLRLEPGQAHFGMIARGSAKVVDRYGQFELSEGMYFCTSEGEVEGTSSDVAVLMVSATSSALRQFGGPVEESGRLRYVSGCSDTLLLSPPRRGDPCLNHLHIPSRVLQEQHYHPSDRVGIILRGTGMCHTEGRAYGLHSGLAWRIPAGLDHHFESGGDGLDVLTWHPDSDFGPTDEDHPMINRTWLR